MLAPPPSTASHRVGAIACCLVGVVCLCVSDAIAKSLAGHYAPWHLLFLRAALASVVLLAICVPWFGPRVLLTRQPALHGLRGVLNVGTASLFYLSLNAMPLATATAVAFCAPLFVVLLSVWCFKERVSRTTWSSVGLGLIGVVVALRPDASDLRGGAVFAVLAALGYALLMVSARWIRPGEPIATLILYIVLAQLVVSAIGLPWAWRDIDPSHAPQIAGLALFSTVGLTLITQAFRRAPAGLIAPLEYSGLLWAALLGWLFWQETPDAMFFIGAALIVGSGVLIATVGRRVPPVGHDQPEYGAARQPTRDHATGERVQP